MSPDSTADTNRMPSTSRSGPSITHRHGFTLIEMLMVLAIIAILALIALPSYLDTIVRNEVFEALPLAEIAKKPVADAWTLVQAFPDDNAAARLPVPEKVVSNLISSVAIQSGAVHITFGNRANGLIRGKILTLRPAVVKDAPIVPIAWVCGYAEPPGQMTVQGENKTNVLQRYLPQKCRAG